MGKGEMTGTTGLFGLSYDCAENVCQFLGLLHERISLEAGAICRFD